MQKLHNIFFKSDRTYTQLLRSPYAAAYEVTSNIHSDRYYEVIKINVGFKYDFETMEKTTDPYEKYPSNEDFGKWAWCIQRANNEASIIAAIDRFNIINTPANEN